MRLLSRCAGAPALLAVVALWHALTEALLFHPTPTVAGRPDGLHIAYPSPNPTNHPYDIQSVLWGRQVGGQNATCGWINGNTADPVSCQQGYYCATASTYVGCCSSVSCVGIVTTCYDILGPVCDARCQINLSNLICPTSLPYCAEYSYPSGSVGYGCAKVSGLTQSVLLTTVNQIGTLTSPIASSTASTSSTFSSISTSSTPTPTPVPSAGGNSIGGGAIAGITIGSVVALALIAALIVCLTRRPARNPQAREFPLGNGAIGLSNRTSSTAAYSPRDPRSYSGHVSSGHVPSGAFAPYPKDNTGYEGYFGPPAPENHPAVYPVQVEPYGLGGGTSEDGTAARQPVYLAGYSGPTIPEMGGAGPRQPPTWSGGEGS